MFYLLKYGFNIRLSMAIQYHSNDKHGDVMEEHSNIQHVTLTFIESLTFCHLSLIL